MPVMQAEKRAEKRCALHESTVSAAIGDISYTVADISRQGLAFFHKQPHIFSVGSRFTDVSLHHNNTVIGTVTFDIVNQTRTYDGTLRSGCRFASKAPESTFEYDFDDQARFFAITSQEKRSHFFASIFSLYFIHCLAHIDGNTYTAFLERTNPFITIETLILRFEKSAPDLLKDRLLNKQVKIMVPLFGNMVFFQGAVKNTYETRNELEISAPTALYYSKQRIPARYRFKEEDQPIIHIPLPFSEYSRALSAEIYNISRFGLCFNTHEPVLLPAGLYCNNIKIVLSSEHAFQINGKITYTHKINDITYRYGLVFTNRKHDVATYAALDRYVLNKLYPNFVPRREVPRHELYRLLESSGYLAEKHDGSMLSTWQKAQEIWDKIDNAQELISCDPVYITSRDNRKQDMTAGTCLSFLRIYNSTILLHQLASDLNGHERLKTIRDIYDLVLERTLTHPEIKYSTTYYNSTQHIHQRTYHQASNDLNSAHDIAFKEYDLYEISCDIVDHISDTSAEIDYIEITHDTKNIFLEYISTHLTQLEIAAYNYTQDDLFLDTIKRTYANSGLTINRTIFGIQQDGIYHGFMICESASDGLNLFNLCDQTRFVIHDRHILTSIINASVQRIGQHYKQLGKDRFTLLLQPDIVSTEEGITRYKALHARSITCIISYHGLQYLRIHLKDLCNGVLKNWQNHL